jgi:O-antigen/teichoic acid export membrane protein
VSAGVTAEVNAVVSPEVGSRAVALVGHQMRYAPFWCGLLLPIALVTRVSLWTILLIGLPISVLVALTHTLEGFARGTFQQTRDLVPIQLAGPLGVLAGCVIAIVLGIDVSPAGLLSWRLVLLLLIAAYFAQRLQMLRRTSPQPVGTGAVESPVIENLRWFAAAKLLFVLQLQSSILIAGLISTEAAGSYTAAFRSAEPIQAGATAAALLVGPATAAAMHSGRLSTVSSEIKQHTRVGVLIAVFPTMLVLAFPERVLSLFGDEFRGVETPLRILVIAPLITTLFGPSMIFASMVKLQRDIVVAMSAAVILQFAVAGLLLAGDALTLTRVAILDVAGTVVWNTVLWQRCRHAVGMTTAVV